MNFKRAGNIGLTKGTKDQKVFKTVKNQKHQTNQRIESKQTKQRITEMKINNRTQAQNTQR